MYIYFSHFHPFPFVPLNFVSVDHHTMNTSSIGIEKMEEQQSPLKEEKEDGELEDGELEEDEVEEPSPSKGQGDGGVAGNKGGSEGNAHTPVEPDIKDEGKKERREVRQCGFRSTSSWNSQGNIYFIVIKTKCLIDIYSTHPQSREGKEEKKRKHRDDEEEKRKKKKKKRKHVASEEEDSTNAKVCNVNISLKTFHLWTCNTIGPL